MHNFKKQNLGVCQFCGTPIREFALGWSCSSISCGANLFRDDKFFQKVLHRKITKSYAKQLLNGETIRFNDVDVHGESLDLDVSWGLTDDPNYKYGYHVEFINSKHKVDTKEKVVTAFDLLNE